MGAKCNLNIVLEGFLVLYILNDYNYIYYYYESFSATEKETPRHLTRNIIFF